VVILAMLQMLCTGLPLNAMSMIRSPKTTDPFQLLVTARKLQSNTDTVFGNPRSALAPGALEDTLADIQKLAGLLWLRMTIKPHSTAVLSPAELPEEAAAAAGCRDDSCCWSAC